jgi:hypothetical protein
LSNISIEESTLLQLKVKKLRDIAENKLDVLPVAVQNIDTSEVILVAYVN